MESSRTVLSGGLNCPTCDALLYGRALLLAFTVFLHPLDLSAQPVTAGITSHSIPFSGSFIEAAGNVYAAGSTTGSRPVTPGAAQTQAGGGTCPGIRFSEPCSDAYVGKADAVGNLVFGTLLGGPNFDYATGLTVDSDSNIYVVGDTGGSFPTTANAAIRTSTSSRVFAAKLSADGSRVVYATYLPETAWHASAVAVDRKGNAYVAGTTTTGHAFITKLVPDGSGFFYDVVLPGTSVEEATAVVTGAAGNAIVTGVVQALPGGSQNLFITRLDEAGHVIFSTRLGGSAVETPRVVQLDSAENIYVAGQTTSLDFPTTPGSFQPAPIVPMWNNASPGGFIVKLSADGSAVLYSSYVMSLETPGQGVTALAVTASGEAYISGSTGAGFAVTESAPQICFGGLADAFVAHLDSRGALLDATYVGGSHADTVQALALANDGSVMLAGYPLDSTGLTMFSRIRFGGPGWSAPACLSPDALNAATLHSEGTGIAPGEFITLTGFGIGPKNGVVYQPDVRGRAPQQLAGVQVFFDGVAAPLLYAQSRQLNVLVPFELNGKSSTNILVQYNGIPLGPVSVPLTFGVPGIFRLQSGLSAQAAALNQDGTLNGPSNPARPGSVVTLWGTGFGATDPPCATGGMNVPAAANLAPDRSVLLADIVVPGVAGRINPAYYAGSAPALLCGIEQINMLVPSYAQGAFLFFPESVIAIANGHTSTGTTVGVTIAVK